MWKRSSWLNERQVAFAPLSLVIHPAVTVVKAIKAMRK